MAFRGNVKKYDLKILSKQLGKTVDAPLKIADLRTLI